MTITVHPDFLPEKKYIIHVLMKVYLGLEYSLEMGTEHEYKITLKNGHALTLEDDFFKHFCEQKHYLYEKNIPQKIDYVDSPFSPRGDLIIIFGTKSIDSQLDKIDCKIDVFAGAFFMLSRWEEGVNPAQDAHGRFPAEDALAFKCGFLNRAVVNEYVEFLWNMLTHLGIEEERKARKFAMLLTHDVDMSRLWRNAFSPIKTITGDIFKRKNRAAARQHFSYFTQKKDPFDTFDALMDESEKRNLQSHFFFISGGSTQYEGQYKIKDFYIKKLITHIHERGHAIGIHPSYDTYHDATMLGSEIEALREVSPQSVKTGRQHFLRFDVPYTWQIWEDNSMEWDSTMGYASQVGFRCGACYPFPVFNVLTRKQLELVERPLLVMEVSLFSEAYMGLGQTEALKKIKEIVATVRQYNGEFVLLWHNSNLVLNGVDYWETYRAVLNM